MFQTLNACVRACACGNGCVLSCVVSTRIWEARQAVHETPCSMTVCLTQVAAHPARRLPARARARARRQRDGGAHDGARVPRRRDRRRRRAPRPVQRSDGDGGGGARGALRGGAAARVRRAAKRNRASDGHACLGCMLNGASPHADFHQEQANKTPRCRGRAVV